MNLDLTSAQRTFAEEAAAWLDANVPREPLPPQHTEEGISAHREWERRLHAAGYAALRWPREFGGAGLDPVSEWLFQDAYIRAEAPERLNRLGLGLAGPAIMDFGTPSQRQRRLPGILSCSELWCQGFSEPDAGSDLAAVRTRAEPDGEDYVLTGQKIWTSLAMWSDWMFALVRTEPGSRRQQGLTFLLIPMASPGIQVRPLRQLHGAEGFAEVFFTETRVPKCNVLGVEGEGWRVATATLGYERGGGIAHSARFRREVTELVELARATGTDTDPVVRDAITVRYVESEVFRRFEQHQLTLRVDGREPGPATSLEKLSWSEMEAKIFETALDVLGPLAEIADEPAGAAMQHRLHHRYWHARASQIFAGTSEVQRNIIAERLLGLPREPPWTSA